MKNVNTLRILTILVIAAVLGATSSAIAADFTVDFPAGLACAFSLRIEGSGGNQIIREFLDENGNIVRILTTGTGSALTFTNLDTGTTLSLRSNGAVTNVTNNADGSQTVVTMGHNILILFPTDVPAGPTTTLYVGRVVFTIDSSGTFTLQQHRGEAIDICASLA
jgi:hypothetical protein